MKYSQTYNFTQIVKTRLFELIRNTPNSNNWNWETEKIKTNMFMKYLVDYYRNIIYIRSIIIYSHFLR